MSETIHRDHLTLWRDKEDILWTLDGMTVDEVIEFFQGVKAEHKGELVKLDVKPWDSAYQLYVQVGHRETDEERDERVARAEKRLKDVETREREMLAVLKAKYESA